MSGLPALLSLFCVLLVGDFSVCDKVCSAGTSVTSWRTEPG